MQVFYAVLIGSLLWVFAPNLTAHAESRFALLIGNQAYSDRVGPLKNPHNDIALVGAALERLGFKVTRIKDAGYRLTPHSSDTSSRCGAQARIPSASCTILAMEHLIRRLRSIISSRLTSRARMSLRCGQTPSILKRSSTG